jgi:predicted LPLAT superfamily acyltransferase
VPFLGRPAPFPEGPFILASLLACPVYLVFCVAEGKRYRVFVEPFADPLILPRHHRREALERVIAQYVQRLEAYCLLAPTQWFNFFDFWAQTGRGRAN